MEPTLEELQRLKYQNITVIKIREKYSQNDENKILREALSAGITTDFNNYNAYVGQCKKDAHIEVYGE